MFVEYQCPTCRNGRLTVRMTADGEDYDLVDASRYCGAECEEAFTAGKHSDAIFAAFQRRFVLVDHAGQFPTYAVR